MKLSCSNLSPGATSKSIDAFEVRIAAPIKRQTLSPHQTLLPAGSRARLISRVGFFLSDGDLCVLLVRIEREVTYRIEGFEET